MRAVPSLIPSASRAEPAPGNAPRCGWRIVSDAVDEGILEDQCLLLGGSCASIHLDRDVLWRLDRPSLPLRGSCRAARGLFG